MEKWEKANIIALKHASCTSGVAQPSDPQSCYRTLKCAQKQEKMFNNEYLRPQTKRATTQLIQQLCEDPRRWSAKIPVLSETLTGIRAAWNYSFAVDRQCKGWNKGYTLLL